MKKKNEKKCQTDGAVLKFNRKNVKTETKSSSLTHLRDRTLY